MKQKNLSLYLIGAFLIISVILIAIYSNSNGGLFKGALSSNIDLNNYKPVYKLPLQSTTQANEGKQTLNSKIALTPGYDMMYYYLFADGEMVKNNIIKLKPDNNWFEIDIDKFRVAKKTDKFYLLLVSDSDNKLQNNSYKTRDYHPYVVPELNESTNTYRVPIDYITNRPPLTTIQTPFYIDLRQLNRGEEYTINVTKYNSSSKKHTLLSSFKLVTSGANSDIMVPSSSTNATKTINPANNVTINAPLKLPAIAPSNKQINTSKISPLIIPKK